MVHQLSPLRGDPTLGASLTAAALVAQPETQQPWYFIKRRPGKEVPLSLATGHGQVRRRQEMKQVFRYELRFPKISELPQNKTEHTKCFSEHTRFFMYWHFPLIISDLLL